MYYKIPKYAKLNLMSKIFFSLAFFLFLSVFPKLTFATISVTSIPDQNAIFQDTPSITIEVNNDQNNFPNVDYSYSAWNIAKAESYCPTDGKLYGNRLIVTPGKITASWNLLQGSCHSEVGQYKFQLWSGRSPTDRNSNSIIAEYTFQIQQTGGSLPTLTPLRQTVQLGTKPTVLVSNARVGNSYTFWWAPSQHQWAAEKDVNSAADLKNGILFVDLDLTDSDFKAGVTRTLCMEIGNYTNPITGVAGLTCRFSTTFTFSNNLPPDTGIQCSVLPSLTPTINDDVSLLITNATPGTSYNGHLDKDGATVKDLPTQQVERNKPLILPLGSKLPIGTYLPYIFDSATGKPLNECSIGFSIGNVDTSRINQDICKDHPDQCSDGGGDPCETNDGRGPAFKTAIGCIHTNPAEFAKDFLTFIIGIGGGLAFLMMLLGAFQMLTSAGNPETLNAGRQRLTSAVIGLLFVIFAVLLLQIIGAGILAIPEFKP